MVYYGFMSEQLHIYLRVSSDVQKTDGFGLDNQKELGLKVPVVVRLEGTNAKEAQTILSQSGVSIIPASGMKDAANQVVKAAIEE